MKNKKSIDIRKLFFEFIIKLDMKILQDLKKKCCKFYFSSEYFKIISIFQLRTIFVSLEEKPWNVTLIKTTQIENNFSKQLYGLNKIVQES